MKSIIATLATIAACVAGCSHQSAPDKVVQSGRFRAVIEYTEKCWEGCHTYSDISFRYRWSTLGGSFYEREIGVAGWRPYAGHVLVFPAKNEMLALLKDSNNGWLLVAFVERDGEPHLRVMAGCLKFDGMIMSRDGRQQGPWCEWRPEPESYDYGDPFSSSAGFSYHDAYWIDYQRQEAHEVRIDLMGSHQLTQVVGLTADRAAVLLVFRANDDHNSFKLCAAGVPSRRAEDACVAFTRQGVPAAKYPPEAPTASPPLPSYDAKLYDFDDMPASRNWRAWLATRFDLTKLDENGRPHALKQ